MINVATSGIEAASQGIGVLLASNEAWCRSGYTCVENLALWERAAGGAAGGLIGFLVAVVMPRLEIAYATSTPISTSTKHVGIGMGFCFTIVGAGSAVAVDAVTIPLALMCGILWPGIIGGGASLKAAYSGSQLDKNLPSGKSSGAASATGDQRGGEKPDSYPP